MTSQEKEVNLIIIDDAYVQYECNKRDVVMCWSAFSTEKSILSIPTMVEEKGDELREKYLLLLDKFSQIKIDKKPIPEHFKIDRNFSLYWTSLVNEKSYVKSPAIYDALRLLVIEEWLLNNKAISVSVYTSNKAVAKYISFLAEEFALSFQWKYLKKKRNGYRFYNWKEQLKKRLPYFLHAMLSLFLFLWKQRAFVLSSPITRKKEQVHENRITVLSPFPGLDINKAKQGEFVSSWWGHLHAIFCESSVFVDWVFMYFHNTNLSPKESLPVIKNFSSSHPNHSFMFLPSFVSVKLVLRVLFRYVSFYLRYIKIRRQLIRQVNEHSLGMMFDCFRQDFMRSVIGSNAIINLLYYFCYQEMMRGQSNSSIGLYLMENQGWEKSFVYQWKEKNNNPIIGFVHAAIRSFDYRYAAIDKQYLGDQKICMPTQIAIHGNDAKINLLKLGFPYKHVCEVEAVRFLYLNALQSRQPPSKKQSIIKVLFLTGQDTCAIKYQCHFLEKFNDIYGDRMVIQVVIKPHPLFAASKDFFKKSLPCVKHSVVHRPLNEVISAGIDFAFVENSTTASIEFLYIRLPFCLVKYPHRTNLSPLQRFPKLFVENIEDLYFFIINVDKCYEYMDQIMEENENLFFLDESLPRWRKLLGLT